VQSQIKVDANAQATFQGDVNLSTINRVVIADETGKDQQNQEPIEHNTTLQ